MRLAIGGLLHLLTADFPILAVRSVPVHRRLIYLVISRAWSTPTSIFERRSAWSHTASRVLPKVKGARLQELASAGIQLAHAPTFSTSSSIGGLCLITGLKALSFLPAFNAKRPERKVLVIETSDRNVEM
jgi:hypothetical protein